jgi:HD-GYP domain-containing protein (c-di-GMP phosphodiesterase class II)
MPHSGEIWYFEQSLGAPLVRPLRRRYKLRALPRSSNGSSAAIPLSGTHRVVCLADLGRSDLTILRRLARKQPQVRVIGIAHNSRERERAKGCFATLPPKATSVQVRKAVDAAFANIELAQRERAARNELKRSEREMEELNRIGVALSETRDVGALLEMILSKARQITRADAGSLYLVEETRQDALSTEPAERHLRFKVTQNDSVRFPFTEFVLPMREDSMAGYSAVRGEVINLADAYRVPRSRPFRFNPRFDKDTGYRTRSLLTLPMKNGRGEVLGVLQLINCKLHPGARLTSRQAVTREVRPFSAHAVRLALSLASQAAVAYENSRLYQDIETLFEGFVKAAVTAIEQRDPTTSGHSQRVSQMTVGLAEVVDRTGTGAYATTRFSSEQMKEIRYAALLHDFGKVGVREEVLVKAKKLYPLQMELVANRFDYLVRDLELQVEREKSRALLELDRTEAVSRLASIEEKFWTRRAELEEAFGIIVRANEPTVLPAGRFDRLFDIAQQTYRDPRGVERPVLTPDELRFLTIPKGSLDPDERAQIESHVIHSFNFLLQIPWTKEIREIPRIARAHHEKLNGTGYPYNLKADQIPVQAKIMTICDMFDALSASDRPYKKAVPSERALEILEMCVKDQELDPELFQLFIEAKIFALMARR